MYTKQNLLDAIKMEKKYRELQAMRKEEIAFGYHEKLKKLGFEDTIIYEKAKAEYYFNEIPTEKRIEPFSQAKNFIPKVIENKIPTLFFFVPEEIMVCVGTDYDTLKSSQYDKEYCEKHNIPIVEFPRNGGVFVCSPDDIAIIYYNPYNENTKDIFRKKISDMAKLWHKNVFFDNNDIIVDGYKVAGFANIGEDRGVGIYISFSIDDKLIENICQKKSKKKPKGLNNLSDIKRDDIIKEVKSWLPS